MYHCRHGGGFLWRLHPPRAAGGEGGARPHGVHRHFKFKQGRSIYFDTLYQILEKTLQVKLNLNYILNSWVFKSRGFGCSNAYSEGS